VDIGDNCQHRQRVVVEWIRNDRLSAPILWVVSPGDVILTLMNQRIMVECPDCFNKIKELAATKVIPGC
jgi:hypothetical protein